MNEIYSQFIKLKTDVTFQDIKLFIYMIDAVIIQLLSSDGAMDRERVLDCFLINYGCKYLSRMSE